MKRKIAKRVVSSCLSLLMVFSVSLPSTIISNAEAESSESSGVMIEHIDVSAEDALAAYDDFKNECEENGDSLRPKLARDASVPKNLYNLAAGDYNYDGESTGQRLYTLRYFKPNSSGEIYMEGYAEILTNTNQNFLIELYDRATNQKVGSFGIDNVLHVVNGQRKLFYYNFKIYNLGTTKEYYMGFLCNSIPSSFNVSGYISHNWTNYLDPNA